MQIKPIFSVPIGVSNHKELLPAARKLFTYDDLFRISSNGQFGPFWTTLYGHKNRKPWIMPDDPAVDIIKNVLVEEAKILCTELGYDTEMYDVEVINIWMNQMQAGSVHETHEHYGYALSGCFYVQVPDNSGLIRFHNPIRANPSEVAVKEYTEYTATTLGFKVVEGDIVMWESCLQHEVPSMMFDGTRMSIAFDINLFCKE